jgi:hypothetical protein
MRIDGWVNYCWVDGPAEDTKTRDRVTPQHTTRPYKARVLIRWWASPTSHSSTSHKSTAPTTPTSTSTRREHAYQSLHAVVHPRAVGHLHPAHTEPRATADIERGRQRESCEARLWKEVLLNAGHAISRREQTDVLATQRACVMPRPVFGVVGCLHPLQMMRPRSYRSGEGEPVRDLLPLSASLHWSKVEHGQLVAFSVQQPNVHLVQVYEEEGARTVRRANRSMQIACEQFDSSEKHATLQR